MDFSWLNMYLIKVQEVNVICKNFGFEYGQLISNKHSKKVLDIRKYLLVHRIQLQDEYQDLEPYISISCNKNETDLKNCKLFKNKKIIALFMQNW